MFQFSLKKRSDNKCEPSDLDCTFASKSLTARSALSDRPLVGDWVIMPDGKYYRFSYAWPNGIQYSEGGSFYLCSDGYASFSGELKPAISFSKLVKTEETKPADFWFFHENRYLRENGVDLLVENIPVYRYLEN